jgi:hypothetical protein
VHPGIILTNLGRHFDPWKRTMGRLIGWTFMKTIPEGAATTCYVATADALSSVSGHYFEDCNPVVPMSGKHMDDAVLAQKLWQKSTETRRVIFARRQFRDGAGRHLGRHQGAVRLLDG